MRGVSAIFSRRTSSETIRQKLDKRSFWRMLFLFAVLGFGVGMVCERSVGGLWGFFALVPTFTLAIVLAWTARPFGASLRSKVILRMKE